MSKTFTVRECFYSLQGEGARAGTANVFLRFSGCNLTCVDQATLGRELQGLEVNAGHFCDTDWWHGEKYDLEGLLDLAQEQWDEHACVNDQVAKAIVFTGGEPLLQLDQPTIQAFAEAGWHTALETNGTLEIPPGLMWVSVSPKPGHPAVVRRADEVRVVVKGGQEPDDHGIEARHYFVSPAFWSPTVKQMKAHHKTRGFPWKAKAQDCDPAALKWAVRWCMTNPRWRLSLQLHKLIGLR